MIQVAVDKQLITEISLRRDWETEDVVRRLKEE